MGGKPSADAVWTNHCGSKSLVGKNVLVTGCTSGIGLEAARTFAKAGAHVYMLNRNEKKNEKVVDRLVAELGSDLAGEFTFVHCDLMSLKSVRSAIQELSEVSIDVLVLNAGLYCDSYKESEDGFETTFQSCHLAHFVLERGLNSQIVDGGRIVVVSSMAHAMKKTVPFPSDERPRGFGMDDPKSYSGFKAYAQAKALNVMYADGLSKRVDPKRNIVVTVLHPGVVSTSIWPWYVSWATDFFMLSPSQGAATTVYCALSDDVKEFALYGPKSPHPVVLEISDFCKNPENVKETWRATERIVADLDEATSDAAAVAVE